MDSEAPRAVRVCTGCGITTPSVDTDFTLISQAHGWRLRRYVHHTTPVAEWWCPTCWAELKRASGDVAAMVSPPSKK